MNLSSFNIQRFGNVLNKLNFSVCYIHPFLKEFLLLFFIHSLKNVLLFSGLCIHCAFFSEKHEREIFKCLLHFVYWKCMQVGTFLLHNASNKSTSCKQPAWEFDRKNVYP